MVKIYPLAGVLLACGGVLAADSPALAQSAADNATTESDDAFGRQIGTERTGLYSSDYIRGFDPVEAGNARLEGLYFDKIDRLPGRVVDTTTIRVGITAQRYPFPAPTGLVEQELRKPGEEAGLNLNLEAGAKLRALSQIEFALPLAGEALGLSGGFSQRWRYDTEGTISASTTVGLLARSSPFAGSEFIAFGGMTRERGMVAGPILFPDEALPEKFDRGRKLGQPWAEAAIDRPSGGVVAKVPIGGFRLEAGLFHNERDRPASFTDIASGVTPAGHIAERTVVADADSVDRSLSGELRLSKGWAIGNTFHHLIVSARGRSRDRSFGGAQRIALGESTLLQRDVRPEPQFTFGAKNRDKVRQQMAGGAYSLLWGGLIGFDLSLSWSDYRKRVDFADEAVADTLVEDQRLLWSTAASLRVTRGVTAYGGLSRGLEDAPIAPDRAVNRSQAPPAIGTRQEEAGVRVTLTRDLTLVSGVFRIAKPYYNLDPELRYRLLGSLTVSGIEVSVAGRVVPGLTIVAGSAFLRPEIHGEAVDAGLIRPRPVGQAARRTAINIDWRPKGGRSPVSLDLAADSTSSVFADAKNLLEIPPRITVDIGARFRLDIQGRHVVIRPRVENLFNEYGWLVSSSGGLTYSTPRSISLQILADM